MSRLKSRYDEFRRARLQVHRLMKEYVADYTSFEGNSSDRQEYLAGKYIPLAPVHSHLKIDDPENILWSPDDIALLIGRDASSISRVLHRMENSPGWCSRLAALTDDAKSANNNAIHVYHSGIFDLIFDKYEDEYLARYTRPRKGHSPDPQEVMRFWDCLKAAEFDDNTLRLAEFEQEDETPEIPSMFWKDVATLIFRKVITARTGIVFSVIFAVTFEISRRWPVMIPIFAGLSGMILAVCAVMARTRRGRVGLMSDIGAVALLCGVFWGIGAFSDGIIYTPGGNAVDIHQHERSIALHSGMWKNGNIFFRVISDEYSGIKEVFFKVDDDGYKSTGFNDYDYPVLMIETEKQSGDIHIEVKYVDTRNKEHGPYKFVFNVDDERQKVMRERRGR